MKKILLINGSPKGKNSTSRKMTMAFLEGLNPNNEYEVVEVVCAEEDIQPCKGCFACARSKIGSCCIHDAMQNWIPQYKEADILIWSFPNFFYGMPSTAKKFLDRLIAIHNPYMTKTDNGRFNLPYRDKIKEQTVFLICTCGFYNIDCNVEALLQEFRLIYGEKLIPLFIPEAEIFSHSFLNYKTSEKYNSLRKAGSYFAEHQVLTQAFLDEICAPVLSEEDFLKFVNASTVQEQIGATKEETDFLKEQAFFRGLALTFEPQMLKTNSSVLEVEIVDQPYHAQLHFNKQGCTLIEDEHDFKPYRLKIVSNLSFFTSKQTQIKMNSKTDVTNRPDIGAIVDILNKYEEKKISKILKLV